jgi:hypothetical protein
LNFGFEVIFFQAVNTSTFFSLLTVLGNVWVSPHGNIVVMSGALVVKGEGSPDEMSSFIILARQGSVADDGLSGEELLAFGATDGSEEGVGKVPDLNGGTI